MDALAAANGLLPGLPLADARALVPELVTGECDPSGDQKALTQLCDWCSRFSPWAAPDGPDGLILDVSGVPHLFGGEASMLEKMQQTFSGLGCNARLAIADTPAAAWAWARHGTGMILLHGSGMDRLGALPIEALRLATDIAEDLKRFGLRSIANLARLPRGPLTKRFGPSIVARLDQLLGHAEEPISPRLPLASWRARASLAEPILTRDAIDTVLRHLLDALCKLLEQHGRGARKLALHAYRVDGAVQTLNAGTSRANRNPQHLFRLYRDSLDKIDPGFGIDLMLLEACATETLSAEQVALAQADGESADSAAEIIDRLQARLGAAAVFRPKIMESHWPERALRAAPAHIKSPTARLAPGLRPVLLLPRPEPVDVEGDNAIRPAAFLWHRVKRHLTHLEGPERIAPEWWRDKGNHTHRDYFRAEDTNGCRYWLFRAGGDWFLHGLFA